MISYLKDDDDLVLAVSVEIYDKILETEYLFVHPAAPGICTLKSSEGQEVKVDISKFIRHTPTDYRGNVEICLT